MTKGFTSAALAIVAILAFAPQAAAACLGDTRTERLLVAFPNGDAQVTPDINRQVEALTDLATMMTFTGKPLRIVGYTVIASGDIAEGDDFDRAPADARASDRALGQARLTALETAILADVPTASIETVLRDNRQVFTEAARATDPLLSDDVRAAVFVRLESPPVIPVPGQPVPTC